MQQQQSSLLISNSENTSFRQKGKTAPGKLIRGFIQDASLKTNISSIPGKFETVIYSKSPKKAFNSTSVRFTAQVPTETLENPGPGSYCFSFDKSKSMSSQSVLGYGNGFLSKSNREAFGRKYLNMGPGPGSYDPSLNSTKTSATICSFQTFETSTKIVKNSKKGNLVIPGPGSYNPLTIGEGKENKTYYSSFVSKSDRNQYIGLKKVPGPGVYEVKRGLIEKKPYKMLGPYSSFANATPKATNKTRVLIEKLEDEEKLMKKMVVPGPGFYDVERINDEQAPETFAIFKTGSKDRFGDNIIEKPRSQDAKILGPGYYPTPPGIAKTANEKSEVSGTVFMSETGRKPFGENGRRLGPNENVPYKMPVKKSFLLNLKRKWVC